MTDFRTKLFAAAVLLTAGCGSGIDAYCEGKTDPQKCQDEVDKLVKAAGGDAAKAKEDLFACRGDAFACNTCRDNAWCAEGKDRLKWICAADKSCIRICLKTSECQTAKGEICEDAVCRPPGCGNDAQCGNGESCLGGSCGKPPAADAVSSCVVLPENAVTHGGSKANFYVVAKGAKGEALPYKGAVTWSGDGVTVSDSGEATGGTATAAGKVKATIGSKVCTEATIQNYASQAGNKVRVVVADLLSRKPVAGAKVVIDDGATGTTGADGSVELDGGGTNTISVFHKDFAYVTYVDVTQKDLAVFLKAPQASGKFSGDMPASKFYNLSDLRGTIRLMLSGASLPGNLIDLQLSTLLGETQDTEIKLSASQDPINLPLPAGTIIGLGEQMFKQKFDILAAPGYRTIWGLGGNAEFAALTTALGPVLSSVGGGGSSDINIGAILSGLLPLLEKLQSGVLVGREARAGASTTLSGDNELKLTTLLRLKLLAELPDLPKYKVDGKDAQYEGGIIVGGAFNPGQGFVPLGITAGIDGKGAKDAAGKDIGDGKIDPPEGGTPGKIPLRLAALHTGLESNSKYGALALAASFSGLVSGGGSGETTQVACTEANAATVCDGACVAAKCDPKRTPLVLAGLISFPEKIDYTPADPVALSFGSAFMTVPDTASFSGRTFNMGSKVDGAAFHRLDIGNEDTGEWFVYFAPAASPKPVTVPAVPEGFDDRFTKLLTGKTALPRTILQSVGVRAGESTLTYDKIVEFNDRNFDDLSMQIDKFSTREIIRPAATK